MRKRTVWIAAILAAIAVVAAAVIWLVIPRGSSAEDQALVYFHALADGDLDAVRSTGIEVSADAASAFLSASEYLSEVALAGATGTETSTIVTISYALGDERFEAELTMIDEAGEWVPDAASAQGEVTFNVPVGIGDSALMAGAAVRLLPAAYEAAAIPAELLEAHATVQVLPGRTQDAELEPVLRPEATEIAQTQLDEHLTTCTATAAEPPPSCGIVIPSAADFSTVSEISYRIAQLPTVALTPTTFQADDGELIAAVIGTAWDGSAKSLTYRTENWTLRGDVTFTVDDIVLSVW